MKKMLKKISFASLLLMFCFFVNIQYVKAITVSEATAPKTCTWEWIRNICASYGPTDPYPTFETSGSCPSGSYWHSDKVQDSCTGERRCGNSGIWTGKTYNIPATYQCTYISGANYGACTGNSLVAYRYVTSYKYSTVSGSSCSDSSYGPVACSVDASCGTLARTYENSETSFAGSWCANGTPSFPNGTPSFPNPGETTVNWTCLGLGGGTSPTTCHASRKLAPPTSADLILEDDPDDNVSVNKNVTSNIKKEWSSENATHCEGEGINWHIPRASVNLQQLDPPGDMNSIPFSARISASQANYSTVYKISCYNQNGSNVEARSNEISDNVTLTVNCGSEISYTSWGDCSKECGTTGTQTRKKIYPNCFEETEMRACNRITCPVSSEWKEVQP